MNEVQSVPRRFAEVRGATAKTVASYLPRNYRVDGVRWDQDAFMTVLISGVDVAGWTLDDYVIPRLGSGLIGCREVTPLISSPTDTEPGTEGPTHD